METGHRFLFGGRSLFSFHVIPSPANPPPWPLGSLGLLAQSSFPELSLVQELLPRSGEATFESLSEDRGQGLRQGKGSAWQEPLDQAAPRERP